MMKAESIQIPLTVPKQCHSTFQQNYQKTTFNTGKLFLFAADQKIEHLNKDFYGQGITPEVANPKHLFDIAQQARISAFATHFGLIARYANSYRNLRYIVKLNSKTNLIAPAQADPTSHNLVTIEQVLELQHNAGLDIVGIGMTVYLGSEHESTMLAAAQQAIYDAHRHGLLTVLWMYPRGKAVPDERHPDVIAGAAGVAVSLGADFVKINAPFANASIESAHFLKQATLAAGNTAVICSGGPRKDEATFLYDLYHQIHSGGTSGAAIGRNIFQKPLSKALKFCNAVASIIFDNADITAAQKLLE